MDYYSTLGLKRGASEAEIKKAYRSMAMKHHPDRGGDEKKFKDIEEAYRFLSDPEKKRIIDLGGDPSRQQSGGFSSGDPYEFHFGTENLNDIFRNFGFGGGFSGRSIRRNRSISINVEVTLEEVLNGKELDAEISVPGIKERAINIKIPPGIDTGQQIKYQGMGDHTYKDIPAGDLIVNVIVRPHPIFERNRESLICEKSVSVWDAMIGSEITVTGIDGKQFGVKIPAGTQPNTVLSCRGEGLPRLNSNYRGDLLIRIKVEIPKNLNDTQIKLIETIKKNGI
jgi:curved DNA-binding protein